MSDDADWRGVDRRAFLTGGTGALALSVAAGTAAAQNTPTAASKDPRLPSAVKLRINGSEHALEIDTRTVLLDALREHVGLTGTKKGCDHGQCGACTVLIDGRRVVSCLTLAIAAQGNEIVTVEGLARDGKLHPMQQSFIDNDAFQCGYCTPGQIVSAIACVREGHAESEADIREYMSGNLCRCAAYPNIVAAIQQAKNDTLTGEIGKQG